MMLFWDLSTNVPVNETLITLKDKPGITLPGYPITPANAIERLKAIY